ncbi:hypothetical protein J1N35_029884 [Gossypium stocksii]|uniref:Uncharacterized protein n=1 Tax=Gossypium stocksii TaxID=47602 RepID=A0A9D3ZTM5_9ROSI|nr:hypothetical protein J1N35_029884 [Gossypium stocksii]
MRSTEFFGHSKYVRYESVIDSAWGGGDARIGSSDATVRIEDRILTYPQFTLLITVHFINHVFFTSNTLCTTVAPYFYLSHKYIFQEISIPSVLRIHANIDVDANAKSDIDAYDNTDVDTDAIIDASINVWVNIDVFACYNIVRLFANSVKNTHIVIILSR